MQRTFEIIAFIARKGILHRVQRDQYIFDNVDNIPGEILRRTSAQAAMGRSVIVLEEGSIKPDWSRVTWLGFKALVQCSEPEYKRLIRGVDSLRNLNMLDLHQHVYRSFPAFAARLSGVLA